MQHYEQYINLAINWGIKAISALAIFIIGKWLAQIFTKFLKKTLEKTKTNVTLIKFLGDLSYFGLLLLVIITTINTLGINTASFTGIIAAVGFAVGMALKDNVSNFGAGVLILFLKPFKVGDVIDAAGASGSVEEIGVFNTKIKSGDNTVTIVPNSNIINKNITNYSSKPIRRIDLVIGVGYKDDLKLVKKTLEEIISLDKRILKEPVPAVALSELAESSVNFNVRPWVKNEDYWNVKSDLLEKIKLTFDEKGINIPYPQMDVHVKKEV